MPAERASQRPSFDERASTVNLALALWTAAVAAVIVSQGGFDDPDPLRNAYFRLATLGLTSLALAGVFLTHASEPSKRLQLAVVASLLAHTALLAALSLADLRMPKLLVDAEAPPVKPVDEEQPPEMVVIERDQLDEVPDFERPLESSAPQSQAQQVRLEREAPKVAETMLQPTPAPQQAPPAPDAIEINRPQTVLAQAAIEPGRRSRSVAASASLAPQAAEFEAGLLAVPAPSLQMDRTPRPAQPLARATAQPLAPLSPSVAAPLAPAAATVAEVNPLAAQPVARSAAPTIEPRLAAQASAVRSRPPTLAQLGPSPMDPITPLPTNAADADEPPQRLAALSAPDFAPLRAAPSPAGLTPAAPPVRPDLPEAAPLGSAEPAPDRLAMRGESLAPVILSDARPRHRAAPLAGPGLAGKALDAPTPAPGRRAGDGERSTELDAAVDRGGLGLNPADTAGLSKLTPNRDATASLSPGRFRNLASGGSPSVAGDARAPTAAFSSRGDRADQLQSGSEGSPSPRTEAAIELGLKFLSQVQRRDGSWSFTSLGGADVSPEEVPQINADAAATGLALLSFLGAGYDHIDGSNQQVVKRGLDALIARQSPEGLLFPEAVDPNAYEVARFYSHGIATIALCEAYGMTGDPRLELPAQRAIDYIVQTQAPSLGGWRYTPGYNSDLSVTGWMLMALRSGELAGLRVPSRTYAGVRQFLESCRETAGYQARFCYNPTAPADDPRTSHGRNPGTVMTSVGLLMQLYLGEGRESERAQRGADHLLANLPTVGDSLTPAQTSTPGNPLRDTYYWYYGTQVMFHMGGRHWQRWNEALHPLLVESQSTAGELAGSWNPVYPVPDKWRHLGGRLYVTTLNLLSLEVYYRHLPLYEMAGR